MTVLSHLVRSTFYVACPMNRKLKKRKNRKNKEEQQQKCCENFEFHWNGKILFENVHQISCESFHIHLKKCNDINALSFFKSVSLSLSFVDPQPFPFEMLFVHQPLKAFSVYNIIFMNFLSNLYMHMNAIGCRLSLPIEKCYSRTRIRIPSISTSK